MNKINELRLNIFSYIGANTGKINKIPDRVYNILRYRYHNKLPASFYLLFDNMPENSLILKNILLTKYFYDDEDYKIIRAKSKLFGEHSYVECNDKIYDISIDAIIDKAFYEIMFGISGKISVSKEDIKRFIYDYNICSDSIEDCQDISFDLLNEIDRQYRHYSGKRNKLVERQVKSFFSDIHYENGMILYDFSKLNNNKKERN